MDADAYRWVDEFLIHDGQPRLTTPQAIELVQSQPTALQIAILKACVEMLPALRKQWSDQGVFRTGEQLYAIAVNLYDAKLPLDGADVCALLRTSQHDCGHGCDVQAPLDRAMSHLADHDASHDILSAVAAYAEALKGVGSIQAQTIKRKVAILLLLDSSGKLGRRQKRAWSRAFSRDLGSMPGGERRAWQHLVLTFKLNERSELPKIWRRVAEDFIASLGEDTLLSRLEQWWPEPGGECKLDTGGSHLLKHFVWLLESVDHGSRIKPACDRLVGRLSEVAWKPKQPAAKVVCAAANYLINLPRSVAWDPLQRLCTMASSREDRVRELVNDYDLKNPSGPGAL